ncbi:MAG: hypothetical protein ACYDHP_06845 [Ferrimicrobium sp.]
MTTSVTVIGKGPAGLLAASKLSRRGCEVNIVAASRGTIPLWSGTFDFLDTRRLAIDTPWEALERLPIRLTRQEWSDAWKELLELLTIIDIPVDNLVPQRCRWTITCTGRLKTTFVAPSWQYLTDESEELCFVGIEGLNDSMPEFQSKSYTSSTGTPSEAMTLPAPPGWTKRWTALRYAFLFDSEIGIDWLVDTLERSIVAQSPARTLLVPQVLGFQEPLATLDRLRGALGRPVFEYPLVAPSVGGMRLQDRWERWLGRSGVNFTSGTVTAIDGSTTVVLDDKRRLSSDAVIMATGGILGGGLRVAVDGTVLDPILDIAVGQLDESTSIEDLLVMGHGVLDPCKDARVAVVGRQLGLWNPDRDGTGAALVLASVEMAINQLIRFGLLSPYDPSEEPHHV